MNIKQIENFIIQKQDILKSFENFKKPDKWDWGFSFNLNDLNKLERKKMKIYIDANGTQEYSMDFFQMN